jgi:hypothetical protein
MATPDPNNPGFYMDGRPIPPGRRGSKTKKTTAAPTRKPLGVSGGTSTKPGYAAQGGYFPAPGATETPLNFGFGVVTPQGVAAVHGMHGISNAWDQGVAPRYFAGDEMAPRGLPPVSPDGNDISTIQHQLVTAGFLRGTYQVGSFDENTQKAYKNALIAANKAGVTYSDIIAAGSQGAGPRISGTTGKPVGGSAADQLQVQLTSPQELEATLQGVAQKLYGGNLPTNAVQQFIAAYQTMQRSAQENSQNAPTTTTLEDPTLAATNYIKTTFPADYGATQVANNYNEFLKMLNPNLPGGEEQAAR